MKKSIPPFKKAFFFTNIVFLIANANSQDLRSVEYPKYYFEPNISFQQKYTNNFNLDEKKTNAYLTEISPGFTWIGNTKKIKGYIDYSLDSAFYTEKNSNHRINNSFDVDTSIEIAEQFAFIDIEAYSSTQNISAFGPLATEDRISSNSNRTKNYKVSPYFKGTFNEDINYELKQIFYKSSSNGNIISGKTEKNTKFSLEKNPENKKFGWSTVASHEIADFRENRTIKNSALKGAVSYGYGDQLIFLVITGVEKTNQISLLQESHSIFGLGGKWKPSPQTYLFSKFEKRYFGNSHEILFEHLTRKTAWRYKDSKTISNGNDFGSGTTGSMVDVLDGFYIQIEPDPVRRRKLVTIELERLGLSADAKIFNDYFRSASTLQNIQLLSLALLGRRSTVTLEAFKTKNERLQGLLRPPALGDDFDLNDQVQQHGLSMLAAHRLTPTTAIFINVIEQQSKSSNTNFKSKNTSLRLGFNTQLAKKTNVNFQIQRSLFESDISSYGESSITGTLTYRF